MMLPDIRQELEAVLMRIASEHGIAIKRLDVRWVLGQGIGGGNRVIGIVELDTEAAIFSAQSGDRNA